MIVVLIPSGRGTKKSLPLRIKVSQFSFACLVIQQIFQERKEQKIICLFETDLYIS